MRAKSLAGRAAGAGQRGAPAGPAITIRDRRFSRDPAHLRWWRSGDPVASAWFAVLSATFPRGESFFVESVKACRDGAPAGLAADIRAFVAQEINHTREHLALNRAAQEAGYDLALTDANVCRWLAVERTRPPIANLAMTAALEHFTAIIAHEVLAEPAHLASADPRVAELWRWHACEEIEHKGVAYDLWLHATRGWTRWRRWRVRSLTMLDITARFVVHRWQETLDLLAQQGSAGWRARLGVAHYLLGRPGILRRLVPSWLHWFAPGFHPWRIDDRALVAAQDLPPAA